MFNSLFKAVSGPWGVLGILLVGTPGGRKLLKKASKEAVRVGVIISEKAKEISAELKEETSGLIAEVKEERDGKNADSKAAR